MSQKIYMLDYRYEGETYQVHIPAATWSEAEVRLTEIRRNGRIVGEQVLEIPVPGLFQRAAIWLAKLFGRTPS